MEQPPRIWVKWTITCDGKMRGVCQNTPADDAVEYVLVVPVKPKNE